jgi:hypothetical protein
MAVWKIIFAFDTSLIKWPLLPGQSLHFVTFLLCGATGDTGQWLAVFLSMAISWLSHCYNLIMKEGQKDGCLINLSG